MSGWHGGTVSVPHCPHDRPLFERCARCDYEREANELAERRRVNDPAQAIRDAIEARRPWFARCSFCAYHDDRHEPRCPWIVALSEALVTFQIHAVQQWAADAKGQEHKP